MDPRRFYGLIGTQSRIDRFCDIPDTSDDENLSDDETTTQKPMCTVYIPESDPDDDDDGDDSDYEVVETIDVDDPIASTSKPRKDTKVAPEWKDSCINFDETASAFLGSQKLTLEILNLNTPTDFFKFLFPSSAINLIVEESNSYAYKTCPDKKVDITEDDIRKFIGMIIYMSVVHLPTTRHYWKEGTYFEPIASVMTCNRFEEIKRFLHFNDSDNELKADNEKYDKLQKIRPLMNIIKERLGKVPKEEYLAVDEQMIPTKTRTSGIKQYNPKKPHKWGYLAYVLSGASGFSYNIEVYVGKQNDIVPADCPNLGVSGNAVLRMVEDVPRHLNYKLFIDNWYTSLRLMSFLHKSGILPLGTIQINRARGINLPKKNIMKKKGRGFCLEKSAEVENVDVVVTSWVDNKVVNMCSTYVGREPMGSVKRFSKKQMQKIDVPCPKAVLIYNKYMGGVDLLDSMLGYYRIKIRSKKWYLRIFFHLVDLICVNSWLLWRRCIAEKGLNEYMPLLDFKLMICAVLVRQNVNVFTPTSRKRGRPPLTEIVEKASTSRRRRLALPPKEVAEDGIGHLPEHMDDRQRCKLCSQKSHVKCEKCKVYLCLNKDRNCYKSFHIVQ